MTKKHRPFTLAKTLTTEEASGRYGVSIYSLRMMLLKKQLSGKKVGKRWYIPIEDLERTFLGG